MQQLCKVRWWTPSLRPVVCHVEGVSLAVLHFFASAIACASRCDVLGFVGAVLLMVIVTGYVGGCSGERSRLQLSRVRTLAGARIARAQRAHLLTMRAW